MLLYLDCMFAVCRNNWFVYFKFLCSKVTVFVKSVDSCISVVLLSKFQLTLTDIKWLQGTFLGYFNVIVLLEKLSFVSIYLN